MKILHINTSDQGGAANACLRLHNGLLNIGIDSKVLVKIKTKNIPYVYVYESDIKTSISIFARIKRKFLRILKELWLYDETNTKQQNYICSRHPNLEMFSFSDSNIDITNNKWFREADIIHLHWVSNFMDYPSFFKKCTKPIVWTLHDMNPFLGGEHYNEQYLGIDENGIPIPRKKTDREKQVFEKITAIKIASLADTKNLHIIALSEWMKSECKKSAILGRFPIDKIYNGINSEIFQPRKKEYSRNLLGISNNKKVILFCADYISNSRKGYEYLLLVLENINNENILLCSIGNISDTLEKKNNVIELGMMHDERLMSIIYSAADVFIIPSLMDNLPNTVIESLTCGTPVISFPIGGLPDMIDHKKNGYIADEISVNALVKAINHFFEEGVEWSSEEIRKHSIAKFDISVQANNIINLYKNIELNNHKYQ
jgi:glycosyltransferase involved in cell wall biosynthesis